MTATSNSSRAVFRTWFFLRFTLIGATFPMVSLWVEEEWGDKTKVGLLMGGIGLMQILTQQLWGYLGDMVWPRRRILLFNMGIAVPLILLTGFTTSWLVFWSLWMVISIFMTPVNPMMNAIVMSSISGSGHYSEIRAFGTLGFIIACFATGILAKIWGTSWVTFPLAVVCGGSAWLWLFFIHTPHIPPRDRISFAKVQRFFVSRPHFLWFFAAVFINRMAHAPMMHYQAFRARELASGGWGEFAANSLFYVGAIPEMIVMFYGGRIMRRFGELRCLFWTTGLAVLRFMLVPIVGLEGLVATQILHSMTFGLYYIAGVSWMNRHTPQEFKTSAQTLHTLFFVGPVVFGSPLFGWLWDLYAADHLRDLYWGGAAIIGLSLMAMVGAIRSEPVGIPAGELPLPGETPTGQ